ncbi:MAG: nucleotidyltransferase domain-containing protein [bacterium]|nr:nucleotidyltransferase domain-containing protein [bacterium]
MFADKNLKKINDVVKSILPESRIILFGSRAKGDSDRKSDYDILVIVKQNLSIKEKRTYASNIMKLLADIPLDVIVKTEQDIIYYQDKIGSITREAVLNGVGL